MEFVTVDVGFWSVVPPLIAIALALITKEVIPSIFLGIASGVIIYSCGASLSVIDGIHTFSALVIKKIGDNASMVVFLSLLGAIVALIAKAGGAKAYGNWAVKKLKSKQSSTFLTAVLGIVIFIDDYFNCLTVGTVMKPVTDRFKVSREKLAYLIDSTAAPVCIIAPISSWAAAVVSYAPFVNGMPGMEAFVKAIPVNFYAVLTLIMVFVLAIRKNGDYGPMFRAELRAENDSPLMKSGTDRDDEIAQIEASENGRVIDLIIPVAMLIVFCISAMLYYGGILEGETLRDAFANTDAGMALSLGGFITLIACFCIYIPRKLVSFKGFFDAIGSGIKAMVPAMIILSLAWTIGGVCKEMLQTGIFVSGVVKGTSLVPLIPAFLFLCACGISFATGTSWGTFGILIPISVDICNSLAPEISLICLAAVLGGGVFGDHCSPISDSTILASTGAGCKMIDHVTTQAPYAATVAVVSLIGYIFAGFAYEALGPGAAGSISFVIALLLLVIALIVLPKFLRPSNIKRA